MCAWGMSISTHWTHRIWFTNDLQNAFLKQSLQRSEVLIRESFHDFMQMIETWIPATCSDKNIQSYVYNRVHVFLLINRQKKWTQVVFNDYWCLANCALWKCQEQEKKVHRQQGSFSNLASRRNKNSNWTYDCFLHTSVCMLMNANHP